MAPRLIGSGMGIANLPEIKSLEDTYDWNLIDHLSIGSDLRMRYIKK